MSEEGERGLNTTAQKLAVTVLSRASSVLPTQCRYYRGVSQKPNGAVLSVVPTPWLKLASEAISVLPTMAENLRKE
jgi:hypothetical protein